VLAGEVLAVQLQPIQGDHDQDDHPSRLGVQEVLLQEAAQGPLAPLVVAQAELLPRVRPAQELRQGHDADVAALARPLADAGVQGLQLLRGGDHPLGDQRAAEGALPLEGDAHVGQVADQEGAVEALQERQTALQLRQAPLRALHVGAVGEPEEEVDADHQGRVDRERLFDLLGTPAPGIPEEEDLTQVGAGVALSHQGAVEDVAESGLRLELALQAEARRHAGADHGDPTGQCAGC